MDIKGLNKIYILHYLPLKERKIYLEKRLEELGLGQYAVWISSAKNDVNKNDLKFYDSRIEALEERKRVLGHDSPKVGKLDILMNMQHLMLQRRIANGKKGISMIFEDDVLLDDNFPERLKLAIDKLGKVKWDVCYADKGSLFVEPKINGNDKVNLYMPQNRKSNTTGAYLLSKESAGKIVKLKKKFAVSPDNEMSYIQKKNNLEVYWTVPFLTHQGSIEEVYKSNVRTGTLTGDLLKIIRKVEKLSPWLARFLAGLSDKLRNLADNSAILIWIKKKVKSYKDYHN